MSNAWPLSALERITDSSQTSRQVRHVPGAEVATSRSHTVAASIPFNNFPIRVFSNHFARAECIEVATLNLRPRAIPAGAGEAPFRNAGLRFQVHKMLCITVMDVGQSFKTCSQTFPDIALTPKARA